jgi:hypothetical protein
MNGREVHKKFWHKNVKETRKTSVYIQEDYSKVGWEDVDWIGTRIIGFHKILGTFQIAGQLLASQEGLSFIELASDEISLSYQGAKLYFY